MDCLPYWYAVRNLVVGTILLNPVTKGSECLLYSEIWILRRSLQGRRTPISLYIDSKGHWVPECEKKVKPSSQGFKMHLTCLRSHKTPVAEQWSDLGHACYHYHPLLLIYLRSPAPPYLFLLPWNPDTLTQSHQASLPSTKESSRTGSGPRLVRKNPGHGARALLLQPLRYVQLSIYQGRQMPRLNNLAFTPHQSHRALL